MVVFAQRKKDRDTSAFLIQPDRVEFEFERFDDQYFVVPGENDGLLVVYKNYERKYQGNSWRITKLDTDFQQQWESLVSFKVTKDMLGFDYYNGKYYLLFNDTYEPEDLNILELSAETGEIYQAELTTVFPMRFSDFEVLDETVILAGWTNYRPVVITFNIQERKPRILPGIYDGKSNLIDVVVDDNAGIFSVMLSERIFQRKYTVRVKSYTADGVMIQDNRISPDDFHNLIDGATTIFDNGLQYFAGTYSRKSTKYSSGLYISKFINGEQRFIKYMNYADLDNFFGYLNTRRENRIKKRISKRKERGRQNRYNYQLTVHEIIERDDHYILVAEAYYPRYSSSAYGYQGAFTPGTSDLGTAFLGYTYTHAIVVAFDKLGNKMWDHSFKIGDINVFSLVENVKVSLIDDLIVLLYIEDNEIRTKVVRQDEILEGKTFNPIRLSSETDELRSRYSSIEVLQEWYDDVLIAYGEQNVGTAGRGMGSSRKIFYINKITYNKNNEVN